MPRASLFSPLFLFSDIGKKKFNKTFINTRPLANNHVEKKLNLSFARCGCPPAVKLNRSWQIELLEHKYSCMVETIPLVAAIFGDPNFELCLRHMLNLAKNWTSRQETFPVPLSKSAYSQFGLIGQLDSWTHSSKKTQTDEVQLQSFILGHW